MVAQTDLRNMKRVYCIEKRREETDLIKNRSRKERERPQMEESPLGGVFWRELRGDKMKWKKP